MTQYTNAYFNRGIAYISVGQYDLAMTDLDKVIQFNPQYANAYYNKAVAYQNLGRKSEAIQLYKLFLRYASLTNPYINKAKERIRELVGTI